MWEEWEESDGWFARHYKWVLLPLFVLLETLLMLWGLLQ